MRPFTFLPLGCAMMLMASFNLFADALVDDCNGTTSQNKFGYYWYFYDDSKDLNGPGNSSLPGIAKATNGDYIVAPTASAGHTGGGIVLPYILGPTHAGSLKGYAYNFVGMGTTLCGNGKTIDLTGATAVTFWLKSTVAISVDFQLIDTVSIKDFNYYHALCALPANTWTQFTLALGTGINGLAQYSWGGSPVVPFSLKTVSKIQWQIHTDNVGTNTSGTVTIDDVVLLGYTYVPPDMCTACQVTAGTGTGALLSDMETTPPSQNARGYYWFCYTDGPGRGTSASPSDMSSISAGATMGADAATYTINLSTPNTNGYSGSTGADIAFTLGTTFTQPPATDAIKPFVGIGTNLWNDRTTSDLYNAAADGATGVYFDYKLSSTSDTTIVLSMEVYDQSSVSQPTGVVHYINLPYTGANWKGAKVPFSKLVLPDWAGVIQAALDTTKLEKIQWKVQANNGVTGEVAIDNVYMLGATQITNSLAVKHMLNPAQKFDGFAPKISNNILKVTFNQGMNNGSISLINTRGEIVARNIAAANQVARYNVAGLSKGVYMLSVKAMGKSGEFSKAVPLTIY